MASQRSVVVIPGRNFGPYIPQLFFPMFAAIRRGAQPVAVQWRNVEDVDHLTAAEVTGWVEEQVGPFLQAAATASSVVVAKSLGGYAAAQVADKSLPAIWVTPVLTNPGVTRALRRSSMPFLLTGGSGDELWDGRVARSLTPHVLELAGADHGLFVDGPLTRSAENVVRLTATEAFLDTDVWPC